MNFPSAFSITGNCCRTHSSAKAFQQNTD